MKKNKKIIFFKEAKKETQYLQNVPKPSSNFAPEWYKNQALFSDGGRDYKKFIKSKVPVFATYKICVPLVDSLTAGYMLTLPVDIFIENIATDGSYLPIIKWNVEWEIADTQNNMALGNYPIPEGYYSSVFRWSLDWKVETPDGYSSFIMHPQHRHDLPFFTLTGFVDTDKMPSRLYLPFFIKDGFEGIVKEGTPIAQILPIKREVWQSERKKYSDEEEFNINNISKFNFIKTYKRKYWSKKEYR